MLNLAPSMGLSTSGMLTHSDLTVTFRRLSYYNCQPHLTGEESKAL